MSLIRVFYLSMGAAPEGSPRFDLPGFAMRRETLPIDGYLELYRSVGGPWGWSQRLDMARDTLSEYLASGGCRIYVVRETPAPHRAIGFCEYDASRLPDVQLVNFGLVPEAFGNGIGPRLLSASLADIWAEFSPSRVWLHTDVEDHPAARRVYERAGFLLYETRMQDPAVL